MMRKFPTIAAALVGLFMAATLAWAANTGYPFVNDTLPPAALNSAFLNAYDCFYGPTAPLPGGTAIAGGCWWNTSVGGQITLEFSADASGAHWAPIYTLNTTTMLWTPALTATAASVRAATATALRNVKADSDFGGGL